MGLLKLFGTLIATWPQEVLNLQISQQFRGWKDKEKNRDDRFLHPWVVGAEGDGFWGLILETVIDQGQICHE
ncbi:hypothetical protein ACOMHN_017409 [Nucella lapillus]